MTELHGQGVRRRQNVGNNYNCIESDAISTNFTGLLKMWSDPFSVFRIGTSYGLVGPGFAIQEGE